MQRHTSAFFSFAHGAHGCFARASFDVCLATNNPQFHAGLQRHLKRLSGALGPLATS